MTNCEQFVAKSHTRIQKTDYEGEIMKLYFADGGSTFFDYSRVGYDSCSLICQTEPFPQGVYSQSVDIDDRFTKQEAQSIGNTATSYVVSDGYELTRAVRHVERKWMLKKGWIEE